MCGRHCVVQILHCTAHDDCTQRHTHAATLVNEDNYTDTMISGTEQSEPGTVLMYILHQNVLSSYNVTMA